MAEHGDGNIKVVVRCRPLNSRGECSGALTIRDAVDSMLQNDYDLLFCLVPITKTLAHLELALVA